MKSKAETMSKQERICVLSFDEMYVSQTIVYDKKNDQVMGPHKTVQVVMARGLTSPWRQPIYFKFDQPMTKEILFDVIQAMTDAGFDVVGITSDQGPTNKTLWNSLHVSLTKTFITLPGKTDKVYVFYDAPHLLKCIRNNFVDSGFVLEDKTTYIGTAPVKELLQADNDTFKIAYKLNENHLRVEKNGRQKVKTAAQLLSQTVSKALIFGHDRGYIHSPHTLDVAEVLNTVDNWFDLSNASSLYGDKPGRNAYGTDLDKQDAILDKMETLMTTMRVHKFNNLIQFQKGVIISIRSLRQLRTDLNKKYGLTYLLTRRLNQDVLENFFSYIRGMGGANDHPDPLSFVHRLKWHILGRHSEALFTDNTNCEEVAESEALIPLVKQMMEKGAGEVKIAEENVTEECLQLLNDFEVAELVESLPEIPEKPLADEGFRYVVGYIAHRYKNKYPGLTETTEEKDSWIGMKEEKMLTRPSQNLLDACILANKIFLLKGLSQEKSLVDNVVEKCLKVLGKENVLPKEVVKTFVRTRLFFEVRKKNKELFLESIKQRGLKRQNGDADKNFKKTKKLC